MAVTRESTTQIIAEYRNERARLRAALCAGTVKRADLPKSKKPFVVFTETLTDRTIHGRYATALGARRVANRITPELLGKNGVVTVGWENVDA